MDSLSTFELIEIALLSRESVDNQFQYWVTITFAVIVASFAAGEKLSRNWRVAISGLYLLATAMFFARYVSDGLQYQMYVDAFIARGGKWGTQIVPILGVLRISIYAVGTIVALTFLNWSNSPGADDPV